MMGEDLPNSQSSQHSTFSDIFSNFGDNVDMPQITQSLEMDIIGGLRPADENPQSQHFSGRFTNGTATAVNNINNHSNHYAAQGRNSRHNSDSQNGYPNHGPDFNNGRGTISNSVTPFVQGFVENTAHSCAYQASTIIHPYGNNGSMSHSSPDSGSTRSPYTPDMPLTPPTQVTNSNLPCLVDYSGDYGFDIFFGPKTESAQKSAQFTHSHILNKLYVKMNALHPVMFKANTQLPPKTILRATPVYMSPDYATENVSRCPNHKENEPHAIDGIRDHLIRIEQHMQVHYDKTNHGRESVCIPYPAAEVGSEYSTVLFKYMCLSSCVGGINRRPISTVFTIENNGIVIGRKSVEVRICSCPGRDRSQDEKRKRKANSTVLLPFPKKKKSDAGPSSSKSSDQEYFCLMVRGQKNFDILKSVKEGLEIKESVEEKDIEKFRERVHKEEEIAMRNMLAKFFKEQQDRDEDSQKPFPTKNPNKFNM